MTIAIVRKALKDQNKTSSGPPSYMSTLDKFGLKVFNRLFYDCEVSRPLVVGILLDLPDYYTSNASFKSINSSMLKIKFPLLISGQ